MTGLPITVARFLCCKPPIVNTEDTWLDGRGARSLVLQCHKGYKLSNPSKSTFAIGSTFP